MSFRGFLALITVALIAFALGAQGRNEKKDEKSPHTVALDLVFRTQQARIREVDTDDWWHDTKERSWVVKRPFSPGNIDSTHWFNVTYRIDGKEMAAWFVDTRTGQVQIFDSKAK